MQKKFILIACILLTVLPNTGCSGGETPVFLPEDNISATSEIFESQTKTITEENISETIIDESEETEFAERADPPSEITNPDTTVPDITVEATQETTTVPVQKKAEEVVIPEYTGPEQFSELYYLIAKYGKGVSVFYKDLTDGEEFFYNQNENYYIASLIKAPYIVYVYKRILAGEGDLKQKYTYYESDYREGTGKIKDMEYGTAFTLEELIFYAIRWSDNVAMDKIRKIFSVEGFKKYAADIGLPHIEDIRSSAVNGRICAKCAAAYLEDIFNFIEENNQYSAVLKDHMLHTINKMIYADYPFARKYGWADASFHDMGIVYNPHRPYLIAILSDRGAGHFSMFKDISLEIQKYNENKPEKIEIIEETTEPETTEKPMITEPTTVKPEETTTITITETTVPIEETVEIETIEEIAESEEIIEPDEEN